MVTLAAAPGAVMLHGEAQPGPAGNLPDAETLPIAAPQGAGDLVTPKGAEPLPSSARTVLPTMAISPPALRSQVPGGSGNPCASLPCLPVCRLR